MRTQCVVLVALAAGLGSAYAGTAESANCGYRGVEVASTQRADLAAACGALADVLAYFGKIGFDFQPILSMKFVAPRLKPAEGAVSYGHADVRASLVVVYASSHRQPWGLPWNKEVRDSFLRHELAHIAVWRILGRDPGRLRREWHEFIAYAVQFQLMNPEMRREVLANFSDVKAFPDLSAVNEFTYGMDPEVFAVGAYLTYREKGAEEFVRGLLRGEITPPAFSYPFPVLPEQQR